MQPSAVSWVPRCEHQRHAATIVGYALAQRLGCAMKRGFLKFNADLRERAPYHTTISSDIRRVKRQLEGVRNVCGANKGEAGAQR